MPDGNQAAIRLSAPLFFLHAWAKGRIPLDAISREMRAIFIRRLVLRHQGYS
jgi:hypothetical protein